MAHAPQFLKLVQDAKKRVKETNVPDVKRRMDAGEKLHLIDVREPHEYAEFNIGAKLIPLGQIQTMQVEEIEATMGPDCSSSSQPLRWPPRQPRLLLLRATVVAVAFEPPRREAVPHRASYRVAESQ